MKNVNFIAMIYQKNMLLPPLVHAPPIALAILLLFVVEKPVNWTGYVKLLPTLNV